MKFLALCFCLCLWGAEGVLAANEGATAPAPTPTSAPRKEAVHPQKKEFPKSQKVEVHAPKKEGFALQYVNPVTIKIFSENTKGEVTEEHMQCTPETCCFAERFLCFMEDGRCNCDLHICEEWPEEHKHYWMQISGWLAERYCGRGRFLHTLTQLCACDPNKKNSPCGRCDRPDSPFQPGDKSTLPHDCRPF